MAGAFMFHIIFIGFTDDVSPRETAKSIVQSGIDKY
jgi:hypothetical protein